MVMLLMGSLSVVAAPSAIAQSASSDDWQEMLSAWGQLEQMMVSVTARIESQHPGYRHRAQQFNHHLRTCTPIQFSDPVNRVDQTIRGWQGQGCRVDYRLTQVTDQQGTCLYSKADLADHRPKMPEVHANCQATEGLGRRLHTEGVKQSDAE